MRKLVFVALALGTCLGAGPAAAGSDGSFWTATGRDGTGLTCLGPGCESVDGARPATRDRGLTAVICDLDVLHISLKAILQGAWRPASNKMGTELRSLGLLPLSHPYGDWPFYYSKVETVESIPEGVVDWVLVELRDSNNIHKIAAQKAGFIKDTGEVVDLDGISPVRFVIINGGYYSVALRHRNHLAVATPTPMLLMPGEMAFDFTEGRSYYDTYMWSKPQKEVAPGVFALWGGDYNSNFIVSHTGPANDDSYLLSSTLGGNRNNILYPIYHSADGNLNGEVSYQGPANDHDFLLYDVLEGVRSKSFMGLIGCPVP